MSQDHNPEEEEEKSTPCRCTVSSDVHYFIDEKWENQRFRSPNWRVCPLKDAFFNDPPQWSSEDYKENRGNIYLPENWSWVTDWEKDFTDTDEKGWRYATWFNSTFENRNRFRSSARRRKWTRKRAFHGKNGHCSDVSVCPEEVNYNYPDIIFSGFMDKRTDDLFRIYTKRYVELRSDLQLFYFKNELEGKSNNGKSVNLFDVTDVRRSGKREFGFEVEVSFQIYYFCSDSQSLTDEWIETIRKVLKTRMSDPQVSKIDEGVESDNWVEIDGYQSSEEVSDEFEERSEDGEQHPSLEDMNQKPEEKTSKSASFRGGVKTANVGAPRTKRRKGKSRTSTKVDAEFTSGRNISITPSNRLKKSATISWNCDTFLVVSFVSVFMFMLYQTLNMWSQLSQLNLVNIENEIKM